MTVRDFLERTQGNLNINIMDRDKRPGAQLKTGTAKNLLDQYRFNTSNIVEDFYIFEDTITIYTLRH